MTRLLAILLALVLAGCTEQAQSADALILTWFATTIFFCFISYATGYEKAAKKHQKEAVQKGKARYTVDEEGHVDWEWLE